MKRLQERLDMTLPPANLYELSIDFFRISEEEHSRIDPEDIWEDLWTDVRQYDSDFKILNDGWSVTEILSIGDLIEKPIVPDPLVMFGWFDLLKKTELATNSAHWKIVSNRLLHVMKELNVHPKLHRIRVIERSQFDNVYGEIIRQYENDKAITHLKYSDDSFYGIQLEEFSVINDNWDIWDKENIPWKTMTVQLPPFFVDPKSPGQILVTSEGRTALELAGIRGVRFLEPFTLKPA
jgi:hypothetical protein